MSEVIRLASVADAPRILRLTHRAYHSIRELGLHFPAASADLNMVESNILNNRCYVLETSGEIASTVSVADASSVKKVFEYPFDDPFIWWFATDPEYGQQGIGRRLLDNVEEIIRHDLQAAAVTLATSTRHPWLVEMYQRRGYELVHISDKADSEGSVILKKVL